MAFVEKHIHVHVHNDNKEIVCLLKEIICLLKKGNGSGDDEAIKQDIMDKLNKVNEDIKSTI